MATYLKRRKDLVWKTIDEQIIVLDIEKSMVYELNETAGIIWRYTSKYILIADIVNKISSVYGIDKSKISGEIKNFIEKNEVLFNFKSKT